MWGRPILIAIVLSVLVFVFIAVDTVRNAFREPPPPNEIRVLIVGGDWLGPRPPIYLPRKFKIEPLEESSPAKHAKRRSSKHRTMPSAKR